MTQNTNSYLPLHNPERERTAVRQSAFSRKISSKEEESAKAKPLNQIKLYTRPREKKEDQRCRR